MRLRLDFRAWVVGGGGGDGTTVPAKEATAVTVEAAAAANRIFVDIDRTMHGHGAAVAQPPLRAGDSTGRHEGGGHSGGGCGLTKALPNAIRRRALAENIALLPKEIRCCVLHRR